MPKFTIFNRDGFYKEVALSELDTILIGRSASCDVFLPDPNNKVSRYHACLVRLPDQDSGYFIRDLSALHSTFVQNEIVYSKLLRNRDVIKIGDYEVHIEMKALATRNTAHLSIAPKRTPLEFEDRSTMPHKPPDIEQQTLSQERLEIIGQLHAMTTRIPDGVALGSWLMIPVSSVLGADRGFVRFFRDDMGEDFEDVGLIASGAGCDIEVSEEGFLDYIRRGECVLDGMTLLAPILWKGHAVGFFCLARRPPAGSFLAEDGAFLMRLGKDIASRTNRPLERRVESPSSELPLEWPIRILGRSKRMQELHEQIQQAAASDSNTLVMGETGAGKELVAMAIHERSRFAQGPWVARNCGQVTAELAETTLFGYARNSGIHGANPAGSPGWFELANHGTLFLDEIQSLSVSVQEQLLRVLEDKTVSPFGAKQAIPLDLKIVAATSTTDLTDALEGGAFRAPLYYRFRSKVYLPPLRERKEDVPLLAHYFLDKFSRRLQAKTRSISHAAMQLLLDHAWPGNVRELEGAIETAMSAEKETLFSWDFNLPIQRRETSSPAREFKTMDEVERERIREALEVTRGNVTNAAQILGYKSRQTLLTKMDKFKIPRNYGDPAQL